MSESDLERPSCTWRGQEQERKSPAGAPPATSARGRRPVRSEGRPDGVERSEFLSSGLSRACARGRASGDDLRHGGQRPPAGSQGRAPRSRLRSFPSGDAALNLPPERYSLEVPPPGGRRRPPLRWPMTTTLFSRRVLQYGAEVPLIRGTVGGTVRAAGWSWRRTVCCCGGWARRRAGGRPAARRGGVRLSCSPSTASAWCCSATGSCAPRTRGASREGAGSCKSERAAPGSSGCACCSGSWWDATTTSGTGSRSAHTCATWCLLRGRQGGGRLPAVLKPRVAHGGPGPLDRAGTTRLGRGISSAWSTTAASCCCRGSR